MEAFLLWLEKYLDLMQTIGVLVSLIGLVLTVQTLRKDAKLRRLSHWLTFTQHHRDLWKLRLETPGLDRVRDPLADIAKIPVSDAEYEFVSMLVHHLSAVHKTASAGMVAAPAGLRTDIEVFFALPVPRAVWKNVRHLHDGDFVQFVESCLNDR